jgi:hypothetical protein
MLFSHVQTVRVAVDRADEDGAVRAAQVAVELGPAEHVLEFLSGDSLVTTCNLASACAGPR